MTMVPFNGDITQSLKWMQNNAPNIQALVQQKADWYNKFGQSFWDNWQQNVFDLRTANPFGLMVWCIILGVPSQLFGLYPQSNSFAYGNERQNYKWDGVSPIANPNLLGGNFAAGGNTTVLNLNDVRHALQLRYVALVSNGRLSFINRMLRFIFNNDQPWDTANGQYFHVVDSTFASSPAIVTGLWRNDWQGNQKLYPAARTNLITDLSAHTTFGSITVTPNQQGPDGTNRAYTYATTAAGGETYTLVHVAGSSLDSYSIFAKYTSGSPILTFGNDALTPGTRGTADFNIQNGTVTRQPGVGSATITPAGLGYYRCTVSFTEPPSSPINDSFIVNFPAASVANVFGPQWELGGVSTSLIMPGTSGTVTAPPDYAVNPAAGTVALSSAPVTGAKLTWTGSINQQPVAQPEQFAVGDGVTSTFALSNSSPITADHYMEYRVGPALAMSDQFLNLLNSPQYGITPSVAGTKYLVVRES